VAAIVPDMNAPWYHTVQQRHSTQDYPSPQELFVELREAHSYGWQLPSLVQQQDTLMTTFTRYRSSGEAESNLPSEDTW